MLAGPCAQTSVRFERAIWFIMILMHTIIEKKATYLYSSWLTQSGLEENKHDENLKVFLSPVFTFH